MWTDKQFWKDATWRAFRSFCQCLAALLGGQAANILTANWLSMLSVSLTAALMSLLMSIDRGRAVTEAAPVLPGVPSTDVPLELPKTGTPLPTSGVIPLGDPHIVTMPSGDLKAR